MKRSRRSSAIGTAGSSAGPSSPSSVRIDLERLGGHPPGPGALGRLGVEAADEVDGLLRAHERAAAQLGEVLAYDWTRWRRSSGLGLVGGRAAVHLVEQPSPRMVTMLHSGRRAPGARRDRGSCSRHRAWRSASSKPPTCSSSARGTNRQLLSQTPVEPVAVADEVADLEEPVAVLRPARSARTARPRTSGRSPIASRRPAGRGRRTTPGWRRPRARRRPAPAMPVVQHAGREHVGAVDHQGQRPAPGLVDAPVERVSRRRRGVVAHVEVAELGAEARARLLAEPLVGVGAVLDDDDLVRRSSRPCW